MTQSSPLRSTGCGKTPAAQGNAFEGLPCPSQGTEKRPGKGQELTFLLGPSPLDGEAESGLAESKLAPLCGLG